MQRRCAVHQILKGDAGCPVSSRHVRSIKLGAMKMGPLLFMKCEYRVPLGCSVSIYPEILKVVNFTFVFMCHFNILQSVCVLRPDFLNGFCRMIWLFLRQPFPPCTAAVRSVDSRLSGCILGDWIPSRFSLFSDTSDTSFLSRAGLWQWASLWTQEILGICKWCRKWIKVALCPKWRPEWGSVVTAGGNQGGFL